MGVSKFNSRKSNLTGVIALVLVLQTLVSGTNASMATGVVADLKISAEVREIERFDDDLFTFSDQILNLKKKSRLTSAELAAARSTGTGIKQSIAAAQINFRSIIAKLKAANQWEALDAKVNGILTSGPSRSIFQRAGGAKKLYEELANNLGQLSQEIEGDVQRLSSRVQSQSTSSDDELRYRAVRVAYQPATVFADSFRCRVAVGGYNLRIVMLGAPFPAPDRINNRIDRLCGDTAATDAVR